MGHGAAMRIKWRIPFIGDLGRNIKTIFFSFWCCEHWGIPAILPQVSVRHSRLSMIFNYTSEYMKELIFELCIYVELSILSPYLIIVLCPIVIYLSYVPFLMARHWGLSPRHMLFWQNSFLSFYQIHHSSSGSAFRMFTFFSPNIWATCFFTLRIPSSLSRLEFSEF